MFTVREIFDSLDDSEKAEMFSYLSRWAYQREREQGKQLPVSIEEIKMGQAGKRLQAIKMIRERTGANLITCQAALDYALKCWEELHNGR